MKKFIIIMFIPFLFAACEKDKMLPTQIDEQSLNSENKSNSDLDINYSMKIKDYDKNAKKIAKAINKELKNRQFRNFLKQKALEMQDGDYDVLLKDVMDDFVDKSNKTFKEILLNNFTEDGKTETFAEKSNNLEKLIKDFPQIQVSIPIGCKEWDSENLIPAIVLKTSEYYEKSVSLTGLGPNGENLYFDRKIAPKSTVIVIGLNERSDENGNIYDCYKVDRNSLHTKSASIMLEYPYPPSNLRGAFNSNGVFFAWDYSSSYYSEEYIDYIVIENLNTTTSIWSIISDEPVFVTGNSFLDASSNIVGKDYYYRLKIRREYDSGETYESYYSSTLLVQGIFRAPNAISTLVAKAGFPTEVELNWSNSDNLNAVGYKIYRRAVGLEQYSLIATVGTYQFNYIDNSTFIKGQEYCYYVVAYNDAGQSQPIYDIIVAPYRKKSDKLVITSFILSNHHYWEDWADGYPEFEISSSWRTSLMSNTTYLYKNRERINVKLMIGKESAYFNQENITYWEVSNIDGYYTLLTDWPSDFAKSLLSINFMEYDGAGWFSGKNFSFSTKINIKEGVPTFELGLSITNSNELTLSANNNCKKFGDSYLRFWDPSYYSLTFGSDLKVQFETRN